MKPFTERQHCRNSMLHTYTLHSAICPAHTFLHIGTNDKMDYMYFVRNEMQSTEIPKYIVVEINSSNIWNTTKFEPLVSCVAYPASVRMFGMLENEKRFRMNNDWHCMGYGKCLNYGYVAFIRMSLYHYLTQLNCQQHRHTTTNATTTTTTTM